MGKVGSDQGRLQGREGGIFPWAFLESITSFCSDGLCLFCSYFKPCSLSGSIVSLRDPLPSQPCSSEISHGQSVSTEEGLEGACLRYWAYGNRAPPSILTTKFC